MENQDREQLIRERAFQIWIEEGQPEGRQSNHWLQAEAELVSGTSPALQPDQQGNMPQEQSPAEAGQPLGGANPDDVAR